MVMARDWAAVERVLRNQPDRSLSLNVGALVDRGMNSLLLEERHDFLEKIRGDQPHFPCEAARPKGVTNRQANADVHIDTRDVGTSLQQIQAFLKGFVVVLVTFEYFNHLAPFAILRKPATKAFC
jgi:hypothetical protein